MCVENSATVSIDYICDYGISFENCQNNSLIYNVQCMNMHNMHNTFYERLSVQNSVTHPPHLTTLVNIVNRTIYENRYLWHLILILLSLITYYDKPTI